MPETVWAIHNFEAEADDEITFHVGEPIIVTQKDELYQDGWWEGTNVRGETGLFPMNYTTPDPPEQPDSPLDDHAFGKNKFNNPSAPVSTSSNNTGSNNNLDNRGINHASSTSVGSGPSNHMSNNSNHSLSNNMANMHISQQSPALNSGGRSGFNSPAPASNGSNSKAIAQAVEDSLNDPQLGNHPSTWSIEQVAYWLRWIGFDSVVGSFMDNEISGAILLELNLNNLKELDIASFGKRFNIMNAITTLKQLTKSGLSKTPFDNPPGSSFSNGHGPNIPPRLASATGGPSPRASYDPRGEYMPDARSPPLQPAASVHSQQTSSYRPPQPQHQHQHQPQPDYEILQSSRNAALARSDTVGSLASGGSMGDFSMPSSSGRAGQRQSVTSAFSSTSNSRRNNNNTNQWDRQEQPQMPTSPNLSQQQQARSLNGMPEEPMYGGHSMDQMNDQYPRPMDRVGPTSPDLMPHDQFQHPPPQPRAVPKPDSNHPRHPSGKADPGSKVVPLDVIGRPDYAGWLKKRGDGPYRTWKSRWFMLKGVTLYYMNSPKDNASKDYIDLIGYKIVQDENIYSGKYCFKAVHDELRNFYFYTDSESDMKGWLKALMKVTIGRDPSAPVISSSNIPTIPLHVAQRMQPRPPSPSKRNRGMGPNGPAMHPQQAQHQQQYDQKLQQKQQMQQQQHQQQQHMRQQQNNQMQLLDYDDQESDGEEYMQHDYGQPKYNHQGANGGVKNDHGDESPVLQSKSAFGGQQQQQQRHSFVQNGHGDDDPWREEDDEGFNNQRSQPKNRPDSELDSYRHGAPMHQGIGSGRLTQEEYVAWINRNLPDGVEPVTDMIQSLRSGVVLVRLVESLSGETVDKKIPNATYTLQMLENLLAAFKFMDRVGISTDGYTVKDVFNGIEDKIVLMFESIRQRFPNDAPLGPRGGQHNPSMSNSTSMSNARASPSQRSQASSGKSPRLGGNDNAYLPQQRSTSPRANIGSEYEALYEEAARSTIA